MVRSRGQRCGDRADQLPREHGGSVPLVLDLHIAHDRWGSSSDPSINGHYPNDIDRSLNETVTDKIRKNRADCNNNPPSSVGFMSAITSTSRRLHNEFVLLLFLQTHREADVFFSGSGVQLVKSDVWRSPHNLNRKSATSSPRLQHCGLLWILMAHLCRPDHTLTHHTLKVLVY